MTKKTKLRLNVKPFKTSRKCKFQHRTFKKRPSADYNYYLIVKDVVNISSDRKTKNACIR